MSIEKSDEISRLLGLLEDDYNKKALSLSREFSVLMDSGPRLTGSRQNEIRYWSSSKCWPEMPRMQSPSIQGR